MEAKDWLKGIKKKLMIAQCMDHEKVLFAMQQLFGPAANWWETYYNTHADVNSITWNEFHARFYTHYVPHNMMKLKKKEFADLKQGSMTMNEYIKSFIQLSRYAIGDINTDEKKMHDMFLNGLNDDIQFQLLNTDYIIFHHMVDKALWLKIRSRKWKRMARGSCHSLGSLLEAMLGPASRSLTNTSNPHSWIGHKCQFRCSTLNSRCPGHNSRCRGRILKFGDPRADESTECAAAATSEPVASIPPSSIVFAECLEPMRLGFGPLIQMWHEW
jgi:hypothetical protein